MLNFIEIHPGQGGYDGAETPCHEDDDETTINWGEVEINEKDLED